MKNVIFLISILYYHHSFPISSSVVNVHVFAFRAKSDLFFNFLAPISFPFNSISTMKRKEEQIALSQGFSIVLALCLLGRREWRGVVIPCHGQRIWYSQECINTGKWTFGTAKRACFRRKLVLLIYICTRSRLCYTSLSQTYPRSTDQLQQRQSDMFFMKQSHPIQNPKANQNFFIPIFFEGMLVIRHLNPPNHCEGAKCVSSGESEALTPEQVPVLTH